VGRCAARVAADSPSAKVGVRVGDQILEVERRVAAGFRLKDVTPLIEKQVDESLTLVGRHVIHL
jgi:C-terminal processing protease CtpA/Prc